MGHRPANKMPVSERAKQFAPFAAIRNLEAALQKKRDEIARQQKPELGDDELAEINALIGSFRNGDMIRLRYYANGKTNTVCGKYLGINTERICLDKLSLPLGSIVSVEKISSPAM